MYFQTFLRTKYRACKILVMNFKISNTPFTFIVLKQSILIIIKKHIIIYFYNIIVFSKIYFQYKNNKNIIQILKNINIMLKIK